MNPPFTQIEFPYREVAFKVALSAGIGMLVGLEREWARKEIGVRTFALSCMLGMLASLLAPEFVIAALVAVLLLIGFLNVHSLLNDRSLELTTSICLVVTLFLGAFVGSGHFFTAAASAIVMIMLLAWKVELERFAGALRPEEIRSAVLLGLLSVIVYPLLPDHFVDPWNLINPRQYWITVVVIAGIGFLNYALLRLYGRRGMLYAAALGGLVNSTATAAELSSAVREHRQAVGRSVALLLITNVSMFVRNAVLLLIFAPAAIATASAPLATMAAATIIAAWRGDARDSRDKPAEPLRLDSPVSLGRVTKFAIIFLALACAGTLAQRFLGDLGVLVVSAIGGIVSSASTTASAASLAATGQIDPAVAGIATVLTSMASAVASLPLVRQQAKNKLLTRKLSLATAIVVALGAIVLFAIRWSQRYTSSV